MKIIPSSLLVLSVATTTVAFHPLSHHYRHHVVVSSSSSSFTALWASDGINGDGAAAAKKKVLVLGGDGFCGWPTSLYLSDRGHDVVIVDNLSRRNIDIELGCDSLTPIQSPEVRTSVWMDGWM